MHFKKNSDKISHDISTIKKIILTAIVPNVPKFIFRHKKANSTKKLLRSIRIDAVEILKVLYVRTFIPADKKSPK